VEASIVNYLRTIARDAKGIASVCGWRVALRWLWCILLTSSECLKVRNLQPADRRMGRGPFTVVRQGARAKLAGQQVFSGIREIWVRDVYLKNNYLDIPPGALVIDLGANLGNFTGLALAQHGDVRVIAVEPSLSLSNNIRESLRINGWSNRASVKRAFLGVKTEVQIRAATDPDYRDAEYVSESAFLEEFNVKRVDFLKCDIEGSEFFLLEPGSKLLSITKNLAIEVHPTGGSVQNFLSFLRTSGFEIGSIVEDGTGACIALCRRPSARMAVVSEQPLDDLVWAGDAGQGQAIR
jgi:FkbM family methyltransferase